MILGRLRDGLKIYNQNAIVVWNITIVDCVSSSVSFASVTTLIQKILVHTLFSVKNLDKEDVLLI